MDLHPVVAKAVVGLLVASALAVIAGLIMLWPGDRDHDVPVIFQSSGGGSVQIETGQVVAQATADCLNPQSGKVFSGDPQVLTVKDGQCIQNTVALSSGPNEGANTLLEVPTNRVQAGVQQDAGSDELTPEQLAKPQAGQPDLSIGDEIKLSRSAGWTVPTPTRTSTTNGRRLSLSGHWCSSRPSCWWRRGADCGR